MTGRLLPEDYAVIRSLIAAQADSFRKPTNGLLRPGVVTGFNVISRLAQVRMDGDVDPIPIQNTVPLVLSEGMRVVVLFQPPSGAFIVGNVSTAPSVGCALSGSVSIADGGGGPTTLTGLSVVIDTNAFYNSAAGTITVPEGLAGVYVGVITANIGGVIPTRFLAQWTTGGVTWRDSAGPIGFANSPTSVDSVATAAINLLSDAGTVFLTGCYQTSGASATVGFNVQFWLVQQTPEL